MQLYETSHPDPEFQKTVKACMLSFVAQPTAYQRDSVLSTLVDM